MNSVNKIDSQHTEVRNGLICTYNYGISLSKCLIKISCVQTLASYMVISYIFWLVLSTS